MYSSTLHVLLILGSIPDLSYSDYRTQHMSKKIREGEDRHHKNNKSDFLLESPSTQSGGLLPIDLMHNGLQCRQPLRVHDSITNTFVM